MVRGTRIAIAALMALAIGALPLVLDRCAESCEAHRPTVATGPACHHTTSTGAHIARVPSPCGHDHSGTTVVSAKSPAPAGRSFDATVVAARVATLASPASADLRLPAHSPPDSALTLSRRSLPLRV